MQILADRIEFCWIHLRGIGSLENSLWGYDGQKIRVWLNALAIEPSPTSSPVIEDTPQSVKESVSVPLDFYPLCKCRVLINIGAVNLTGVAVLMDKGIVIGVEHEAATRSNLPFVMFRHVTSVSVPYNNNESSTLITYRHTSSYTTSFAITSRATNCAKLSPLPCTISIWFSLHTLWKSFCIV